MLFNIELGGYVVVLETVMHSWMFLGNSWTCPGIIYNSNLFSQVMDEPESSTPSPIYTLQYGASTCNNIPD